MPVPQQQDALASSFEHRWHRRLTQFIDAGIASTVLVAPLFMGGRGSVGRFVFLLCVAITALLWCARQCLTKRASWRKSGVEWLLFAGLCVLLVQLMPLPQTILSVLSPRISELLPLWSPHPEGGVHLGIWNQISLHPQATLSGLATYVAYAMLFLVTFQRLNEVRDVQRLLRLIAVSTCLLAVVGLGQFLFGNGKFLWLFEHVSRDTNSVVRGPFQNQNHFAHLLALGIGPLLWWLATLDTTPQKRRPRGWRNNLKDSVVQAQVLWVALGCVTFAALLTFSRGGVVAMLLAALASVAILTWKRMFSRRALSVVAIVACLMVVSLSIHGYEPLARKLGTLRNSQSINELSHGRWALWSAHFEAIPDFWMLGSGVGTHRDIYPTYLNEQFDVLFTHGESGYLQLALETGMLGMSLFFIGVFFAFRWALVPLRDAKLSTVACAAAVVPGLIASVVHSLGDFVWYIPACMTTTVLLMAAACRLFYETKAQDHAVSAQGSLPSFNPIAASRGAWIAASVLCLLASTFAGRTLLNAAVAAPSWYEYQRLLKTTNVADWQQPTTDDITTLSDQLEATLAKNPNNAYAHTRLAGLYLQQFDVAQQYAQNPMPLSQVRDAALASQFPSRDAMNQWIQRAVGSNRQWIDKALMHARQGVALCPLQGEGYTFLASLAFLESPVAERKSQYVRQALATRPHDGRVLYVAGQESLLAGDVDRAIELWKRSFHQENSIRNRMLAELAAIIPPNDLLIGFDLDVTGCVALHTIYSAAGEAEASEITARYCVPKLEALSRQQHGPELATTLRQLGKFYSAINAPEAAIAALQKAVAVEPSHFETRRRLAQRLFEAARTTEALEHIEWCSRRRPEDQATRDLLTRVHRASVLEQAQQPTSNSMQIR